MSGSDDWTIQVWDAQTGGQVGNPLQGHTFSVQSVAFSPDGRHIVSGSHDKTIQVWDAQTGGQVGNPLQGHTDTVWSVAFSPNGRHIVSGSHDKTIQVWDAQTGGQVGNPLQGYTDSVWSVAFSPDGRHIVSGSGDKTIRVWDAQTGGQVGNPLQGYTDSVLSATFSVTDLVSGSYDENTEVQGYKPVIYTSVNFSSSAAQALQQPQSLFTDISSDVKGDYQNLVKFNQSDGWIVGPNGKLLIWIPFCYRSIFYHSSRKHLVIPRGSVELDLSRMSHGPAWHKCYSVDTLPS